MILPLKKKQKGRVKGCLSLDKLTKIINNQEDKQVFQLISKQCGIITEKQVNTLVKLAKLRIKKQGIFLNKLQPYNSTYTKKASKTRMGKGKGSVEYKIRKIKAGLVLFEVRETNEPLALNTLRSISKKLHIKTFIHNL